MCLHGRGKVSHFLNRLLHELIGFVQAIILTLLVCRVNLFFTVSQISLKMISFYYEVKIGNMN